MVVCDSIVNADLLQKEAKEKDLKLKVLVDVDGGQGRTGIHHEQALGLGKHIHEKCSNLQLKGVQCYIGHVQHISDYENRKKSVLENIQKGAFAVRQFRAAGLPCEIFTGGGTGSHDMDIHVEEFTDLQPGSYVVMDVEYKTIGSADNPKEFSSTFKDPPMTLMSTVVNNNHNGKVTIDAGLKSLYRDGPGPLVIFPLIDCKYAWAGDEHGYLLLNDPNIQKPAVGSKVELIVSHCDPTINLFNKFFIVRDDVVIDEWKIESRGCVQ